MVKKRVTRLKNQCLNFSEALELLKRGFPLSRSSWVENVWVMIPNAPEGNSYAFTMGLSSAIARMNNGFAELDCFFILKKDGGQFDVGWLPRASDLLASDWLLYDEDLMWKNPPSTTTSTYS